jgi:Uma2 family endonuclease
VTKRREYAEAGIPEYWIVDPGERTIAVLHLTDGEYAVDGPFRAGQEAASRLLAGFKADVQAVFDAVSGGR